MLLLLLSYTAIFISSNIHQSVLAFHNLPNHISYIDSRCDSHNRYSCKSNNMRRYLNSAVKSLFFVDKLSIGADGIQLLEGVEANHAIRVMRLTVGEEIKLSDGSKWISGPIQKVQKNSLTVSVRDRGHSVKLSPELTVIQAITKSDRNKEMLELLTVAGVDAIIPWQAERSISRWQEDSLDKWKSSVKEAAKQSRRSTLPLISNMMTTHELLSIVTTQDALFVLHEKASVPFSEVIIPTDRSKLLIVIGPEGGLSDHEMSLFASAGATPIKLGPLILRSAHAGFAALVAIQTKLGRY